jgi:hypothetical protein
MQGSTNPRAPRGKANGNYRSGLYTLEMMQLRAWARALREEARELDGLAR